MHIAGDGADDDLAGFGGARAERGLDHGHGGAKGFGGHHHVGEKVLVLLPELARGLDAGDDGRVDDVEAREAFGEGLLGCRGGVCIHPFENGLLEFL